MVGSNAHCYPGVCEMQYHLTEIIMSYIQVVEGLSGVSKDMEASDA